jgi:TRAP transporter TAXI family solute receptor
MSKRLIIVLCSLIVLLIVGVIIYYFTTATPPSVEVKPVSLRFATYITGSGWYVLGGAIAEILRERLPQGSTIDVLPYAGGVSNNILVANKTVDMALSFTYTAKMAFEGYPPFTSKLQNLRLVACGLDVYWFAYGVTSYSDVKSIDDIINPKHPIRVATGPKGSSAEHAFRLLLEAYNMTYEDLKGKGVSIMFTDFDTILREAQAGRLDVIITVTNPGHPTWTQLFISPGMRFLSLPEKVLKYLHDKYGLESGKIPAGTFPNSNEAITVQFSTVIIVRDDMPSEIVYIITKALAENKDKIVATYKAATIWDPSKWKECAVIPYASGATKYYEEKYGK